MTLRFSDLLTKEELSRVNYYTYFPVLETRKEGVELCRLLPSDDAVSYTVEFETVSKKVIQGEVNWFNEILVKNIDSGNLLPENKISLEFRPSLKKDCIVLNLIDSCYGHSFVKLLNILDFYREYGETHDIVVLSFGYVKDFLSKEKVNIVHLDLSFGDAHKLYSFRPVLDILRSKYSSVDFAVLDAYKTFEDRQELKTFFNFFGGQPNPYAGKRFIVFNYRKGIDRSWGGLKQARNVTRLFETLKEYFTQDITFCVIGDKDKFSFPAWVLDKRIEKFPNPVLFEYHHLLENSVCVIGLLGSHMLAASVLSPMTVHMTSERYLRVAATDIINYRTYASRAYFSHVYMEGNATLSDYKPRDLAYKILMLFLGKISLEYKEECHAILRTKGSVMTQRTYILKEHAYFRHDHFLGWKRERDAKHIRTIRIKTLLSKFI